MPKQLCFIGTSHLGPLVQAWQQRIASTYPEFQCSFFVAPNNHLFEAQFEPRKIVAPAHTDIAKFFKLSAGQSTIEINQYDAFIFHALHFPVVSILATCQQMQANTQQTPAFFSTACLTDALEEHIKTSSAALYIEHIRQYSQAPLLLATTPKVSILALQKHPEQYQAYLEQAELFDNLFLKVRNQVFANKNILMLRQPQKTLANPYFTKFEYSLFYQKKHKDKIKDYFHTNMRYGVAALTNALERIKTLTI